MGTNRCRKESMAKPRARSVFQIQRDGLRKIRSPLTELEILIMDLISKAEQRGRIGYMALNKLKDKNGRCPGWGAYYTINLDVQKLKADLVKMFQK